MESRKHEKKKLTAVEVFAEIISLTLHPATAFLFASYTLITHFGLAKTDYILAVSPFIVLTGLYIILTVFVEKKSDLDFSDVKTRPPMLSIASLGLLISIIMARFIAPEINLALERILIILIMTTIISMYWKISVHAISFSIAAFLAVRYLSEMYFLLFLLLPLLYWARIYLRKHELLQLIIGSIISAIILI